MQLTLNKATAFLAPPTVSAANVRRLVSCKYRALFRHRSAVSVTSQSSAVGCRPLVELSFDVKVAVPIICGDEDVLGLPIRRDGDGLSLKSYETLVVDSEDEVL